MLSFRELRLVVDYLEGSLSVATWDDTAWIGGTASGTIYRSVVISVWCLHLIAVSICRYCQGIWAVYRYLNFSVCLADQAAGEAVSTGVNGLQLGRGQQCVRWWRGLQSVSVDHEAWACIRGRLRALPCSRMYWRAVVIYTNAVHILTAITRVGWISSQHFWIARIIPDWLISNCSSVKRCGTVVWCICAFNAITLSAGCQEWHTANNEPLYSCLKRLHWKLWDLVTGYPPELTTWTLPTQ